jgi:hypothetical protein
MASKRFEGQATEFEFVTSTGSHENAYGVGSLDVSMLKPDKSWVDLLDIRYTNHTEEDYREADRKRRSLCDLSDMNRRLSKKQAEYLKDFILAKIREEFNGVFPSDREIRLLRSIQAASSTMIVNTDKYQVVFSDGKLELRVDSHTPSHVVTDLSAKSTIVLLTDAIFNRRFGDLTLADYQHQLNAAISTYLFSDEKPT